MNLESKLARSAQSIPPSAIRRFFDLANEMKGQVISLSIGEPDFVTPWSIREAGIYSLERGNTHYSPNQGFMRLREAVSSYMHRRFSLSYDPGSQVVVTVGGSEAIDLLVRSVVNPGDEVIIPEPCFVSYQACVRLAGGIPVTVDCTMENGFKLTAEALKKVLTEKTKLVMLGFPNNPTGAVMGRADIEAVASVLADHETLILSDELYAELTYEPAEHFSIAQVPAMKDRTIVIGGFSKAFAMTGWRLGYACGPKTLIETMNKIHQYAIMCSPTMAQEAAVEALENVQQHVQPMLEKYNQRRRFVVQACCDSGLSCFEPLGAFYVFPDISSSGLSSTEFCEQFLQEEKVAIVPGQAFGSCGEGHVRISYAASLDNIREAMHRLKRFLSGRK